MNILLFSSTDNQFEAATFGEFTREEFVEGLKTLRCDSVDKIREKLASLKSEISSTPASFKDLYSFLFEFGRANPNAKILGIFAMIV